MCGTCISCGWIIWMRFLRFQQVWLFHVKTGQNQCMVSLNINLMYLGPNTLNWNLQGKSIVVTIKLPNTAFSYTKLQQWQHALALSHHHFKDISRLQKTRPLSACHVTSCPSVSFHSAGQEVAGIFYLSSPHSSPHLFSFPPALKLQRELCSDLLSWKLNSRVCAKCFRVPAVSPRKTGLRSTRAKVHENGGDIS